MNLCWSTITRATAIASVLALAGAGLYACSAGGDDFNGGGESGSGGGGSGTGGTGNGTGASSGSGGAVLDAMTGDGSLTEAGACAAESYPGQLVPLDMHIMFDQSGSMGDSGKWTNVTLAFKTFLNAPESDGIGVSIQYFPIPPPPGAIYTGTCNDNAICGIYGPCMPGFKKCSGAFALDTSCDVADYSQPEVQVGELPDHAPAIIASIDAHDPQGDATPTRPAFDGVANYATAWAVDHPAHLTYIVFATDGEPTGCTYAGGIDETADTAAAAANGNPSVKTFVIGVGTELGALNAIAASGQTGSAYLVDTGANVADQFVKALNEIRAAGACKFQIPVPQGGVPDFDLVNVAYNDPPNEPEPIKYVADEASCDPTTGGWHYDDANNPKMIVLCGDTCDEVMLGDGSIDVLLGCERITY